MTSAHRAHEPVLVGVDGSESALAAVRWGAAEARLRGTGLRLVSAFGWMPIDPAKDMQVVPEHHATMLQEARERLATAAAAAEAVAPGVAVTQELLTGYPIPLLLEQAHAAQLLAIGDRGLGGLAGLLIGSVAVTLAARGDCPVVVVRGDRLAAGEPLSGPVVVGVDGSPTSEAAVAFAYEEAALRGAPLVAVHTWLDSPLDLPVAPLVDWGAVEQEEQVLLAERTAGWAEKFPDVTVQRVVTRDRPAQELVARSAEAQLLVVGSRGRGSFTGLILGSVSHAVLHHAQCPVAVLRAPSAGGGR